MRIDIIKPSLMTGNGEVAVNGFSSSQNNWVDTGVEEDLNTYDWSKPLVGCTATLFFYTVSDRNHFVDQLLESDGNVNGLGLELADGNKYTLETAAGMVSKHGYDAGLDVRGQLYKG